MSIINTVKSSLTSGLGNQPLLGQAQLDYDMQRAFAAAQQKLPTKGGTVLNVNDIIIRKVTNGFRVMVHKGDGSVPTEYVATKENLEQIIWLALGSEALNKAL